MKDRFRQGMFMTIFAGIAWGFSGTCAEILFKNFGISPIYLSSMRLIFSGIILTIAGLITNRERLVAMLTNKISLIQLVLFALLGILFNQVSYLEAISHSNSGTATILQYIGPVLCMITECILIRRLPTGKEVIAIILAMLGTFILATHGDIHRIYITPPGLFWGFCAALAIVFYTFLPIKLIENYGAVSVTGCAMLIGGAVISTYSKVFSQPLNTDPKFIALLVLIILLGTIVSYTLYLCGISRCGPVVASMLASVEPVSATVFMVVLLNVPFSGIEALGFACIFVTVFILARSKTSGKNKVSKD